MPLAGLEKGKNNFINKRINDQKSFWPGYVKKWDEENGGKRFRSEIMSLSELWKLYLTGVSTELSAEEEARGKKPDKIDRISQVVPIKAFELPGRFHEPYITEDGTRIHKEGWGYLHFDQWLYARDQARKDLFWLCKEVFSMDLYEDVHRVVCNQFVSKNFDGVYEENYSLRDFHRALSNQSRVPTIWAETKPYVNGYFPEKTLDDYGNYIRDPIEETKQTNFAKTMILLDPRGFFKSSIDVADCIQWIINCPDIRILIVSGVNKLAAQFMVGVKQGPKGKSFYLPRGVPPSPFHYLFPEFVVRGVDGTSKEDFRVNENIKKHLSLDPTLGIISVGSSLSGVHCDVLKFDDIVTDDNCLTEDAREAILLKADGAVNLLMDWGWHDIIGTRYYPDDYYGQTEATHKKDPEMFNLKFFQRACWTVKEEFKDVEARSLYDLTEDMVTLTFPQKHPKGPHYSWLELRAKLKNEKSFRCFPAGSKVLMGDWTEKAIEDIRPGDEIIGFDSGLKKAVVTHVHEKRDLVSKFLTEQGRTIFSTRDHKFLRPNTGKKKVYGPLKIGTKVVSVYSPSGELLSKQCSRDMDWLRGGSSIDKIISIEDLNEQPVYTLTTTTGNYVCQGFAVANCQQLNQPVWGEESTISFDRPLLESRKTKTLSEVLSVPGYVYGAIDLAKENKQFSDYTALAIGKVYQEGVGIIRPDENGNLPERPDGKWVMVILDVEFGKWSQTEIANRIAKMNDKWRPKRWYGEDLGGLQTFKEKIIEVSKTTYGHWPYIPWVTPDNNENSKRNRIKGVEILLRASRLYFLIAPWNVDVFEQLENYKGQKSTRYSKDDVPDVISLLTKFIPSLVPLSKREMEQVAIQRETEYKELLRREIKKVVFGDDGGGFGVNNINRIWTEVESPKEDTNRGPMADISRKFFGGNGMRA